MLALLCLFAASTTSFTHFHRPALTATEQRSRRSRAPSKLHSSEIEYTPIDIPEVDRKTSDVELFKVRPTHTQKEQPQQSDTMQRALRKTAVQLLSFSMIFSGFGVGAAPSLAASVESLPPLLAAASPKPEFVLGRKSSQLLAPCHQHCLKYHGRTSTLIFPALHHAFFCSTTRSLAKLTSHTSQLRLSRSATRTSHFITHCALFSPPTHFLLCLLTPIIFPKLQGQICS
jgi:hypothetical protein